MLWHASLFNVVDFRVDIHLQFFIQSLQSFFNTQLHHFSLLHCSMLVTFISHIPISVLLPHTSSISHHASIWWFSASLA